MKLYYFVDHTSRYTGNSGVQHVVRGLARALFEAGCELVFVGWDADRKALVPIDNGMLKNLARFHGPVLDLKKIGCYPSHINNSPMLHKSQFAPAGAGWLLVPEVTHLTFHDEPPTQGIIDYCAQHGLKAAFIFYDAIPLKHPAYSEAEPRHAKYMQQLALADLIIPISKYAANDLVSFYLNRMYFQRETLPVIYPLLLPSERIGWERRLPNADHSIKPKLIISVGTIEPRKNQVELLQAFQRFCNEYPTFDARLILIGNLHPLVSADVLRAMGDNPKAHYLEQIDDNILNGFYSECEFTVFPSIEEGFGLPIVESLWNGKPCICANFGSMAEIAEDGGCLQVDTRSVDEIYAAVTTLLLEPEPLANLRNEISERKFNSWINYALNLMRLIEREDAPSAVIRKIYYWVDHTRTCSTNDVSQQVVRGLAAALQLKGIPIVPVIWNNQYGALVIPDDSELAYLEKWNGPAANLWDINLPSEDETGAWLVVPESLTYQGAPDIHAIVGYARTRNLQTAIVSPENIFEETQGGQQCIHADYMSLLPLFDLVLTMSEQSNADLLNYLRKNLNRLVNIEHRLKMVPLPIELSGGGQLSAWAEYGQHVLRELAGEAAGWHARAYPPESVVASRSAFHAPILSICISTYNRAPWLTLSLPLLLRQTAPYRDVVEVIVCDNASTDETPKVVEPYLNEPGFYYFRNQENVGMLGNLKVTAQHAQGQYVWILGDDDLLHHGTVERVIKAILEHPDVSLVYLNYDYTTIADAEKVGNVERFLRSGIPTQLPSQDLFAPIHKIATLSENFFTAIYCLVYRRDHALRAYSQNTNGRPFSSLLTCIPTSYYVCQHMMDEAGYWVGEPGPIVNMNVSWGKYAPLWILERLPELYDLAELRGANPAEVDYWRSENLPRTLPFLEQIYFADTENNIQFFSIERFFARHKHLQEFREDLRDFMVVYEKAYKNGHRGALVEPAKLLAQFGLM